MAAHGGEKATSNDYKARRMGKTVAYKHAVKRISIEGGLRNTGCNQLHNKSGSKNPHAQHWCIFKFYSFKGG